MFDINEIYGDYKYVNSNFDLYVFQNIFRKNILDKFDISYNSIIFNKYDIRITNFKENRYDDSFIGIDVLADNIYSNLHINPDEKLEKLYIYLLDNKHKLTKLRRILKNNQDYFSIIYRDKIKSFVKCLKIGYKVNFKNNNEIYKICIINDTHITVESIDKRTHMVNNIDYFVRSILLGYITLDKIALREIKFKKL